MTRGKGEGGLYKNQQTGLWTAVVELPPHNGQRRRKVIRSKDKRVAQQKMQDAQTELRKRGDLPTRSTTVQAWFDYWLDRIVTPTVRPTTASGYRSVVTHQIIPALGASTRLDKVTPAMIRNVHDQVLANGRTTSYANTAHRAMHTAFKAAVREGRITSNPAELVAAPRIRRTPQEALTGDEAIAFLEHIQDQRLGTIWATALLTGARRGEVLGIQRDRVGDVLDLSWQLQHLPWKHGCDGKCRFQRAGSCPDRRLDAPADFEYQHLRNNVYLTRPKTSRGWRIIPLVDPLRTILERQIEHMNDNPWGLIFTDNDGNPHDPIHITRAWSDTIKGAGIDRPVVMHGLRHTAVDLLYLAGVPEDVIQEILGHSSRLVTQGYKTRGNRERLTTAMQQLSAMLTPIDGSGSDTR